MRALAFDHFGGPDVLYLAELPVPVPGPKQLRIAVRYSTVNPTDESFRSGRLTSALGDRQPPYIPGMELAGTVDAVGEGSRFTPGQRVMAITTPIIDTGGAHAEFVVVDDDSVAVVPDGVDLASAATVPMNGLTVQLTFDRLALPPGAIVGVTGAAGAVGRYVLQLGRVLGYRMIAQSSVADRSSVMTAGAWSWVERDDDWATAMVEASGQGGVDAMVDAAVIGSPVLNAVRDGGTVASLREFNGESVRDITLLRIGVRDYLRNRAALEGLAQLAADGSLRTPEITVVSPDQLAETQRRLAAGGTRGRFVADWSLGASSVQRVIN